MTEAELLSRVKDIIHQHLGNKAKIVLFGSRASGQAVEFSDYDIGIQSDQEVEPLTLARINSDIDDLPTLKKVDVVDLNRVTKRFYTTAMAKTKAI